MYDTVGVSMNRTYFEQRPSETVKNLTNTTCMMKRVLITGATSGIGRDFAHLFSEKGYGLFIVSRNKEKLREVKKELANVETMAIDLSQKGAAKKVYDYTKKNNLPIHVLVNNAGFGTNGEHTNIPLKKIDDMIGLNITTLTDLCSLFGNEMKKTGGYILNVASTAAFTPTPYFATYGASKSYVLSFSEALRKELEDHNVVVTCLCPGVTKTNFFKTAGVGDDVLSKRMDSRRVAEIGVNALFAKKLSVIAGTKNAITIFLTRFLPRSTIATLAKNAMKK